MRKCHRRKAQLIICAVEHLFRESKRTADDHHDLALPLISKALEFCRELFGAEHFSVDRKCNHIGAILDMRQNPLALLLLDLLILQIARLVRCLLICDLNNLKLAVTAQTLLVLCNRLREEFLLDFSNCNYCNFHLFFRLRLERTNRTFRPSSVLSTP